MPKPWAKYEVGYMRHPTFLALNARAICLWHEGMDYCAQHRTAVIPADAMRAFRFWSRRAERELQTAAPRSLTAHFDPLWVAVEGGVRMGWPWIQPKEGDGRPPMRRLLNRLIAWWGDACVYCGAAGIRLEVEHIVPRARGGSDDEKNLTVACRTCNSRKRTKTAAEFGFPHIHERAERLR